MSERTPKSYRHARLRCVLPRDGNVVGIAFNVGDDIYRIVLDVTEAKMLAGLLMPDAMEVDGDIPPAPQSRPAETRASFEECAVREAKRKMASACPFSDFAKSLRLEAEAEPETPQPVAYCIQCAEDDPKVHSLSFDKAALGKIVTRHGGKVVPLYLGKQ